MSETTVAAPATFVYVSGRSDTTWRAEWPAQAIGAKTVAVPESLVDTAFAAPNVTTPLPWLIHATTVEHEVVTIKERDQWYAWTQSRPRIKRVGWEFPSVEGAALFIRPCLARAALAQLMRRGGVMTIGETDDNYFAPNRQNIVSRDQALGEKGFDLHAKAMASMDRNIFSTAWLRDRYQREYKRRFGKDKPLPEPFICRNHVPSWAWPEEQAYEGPPRVGFMGSSSHLWDVHGAHAAFHAAKHVGAKTVMIGYNPADPDPGVGDANRTEKSLAVSRRWDAVVDEHITWIDPAVYHRVPLPLDIGLAPLRKNEFNLGKSDVKMVEYAISGAAGICSRHPVFERAGWVDEVNCLMAKSQEHMGVQTLRLLRDLPLRQALVDAAREMIRDERNEDVMAREWGEAVAA